MLVCLRNAWRNAKTGSFSRCKIRNDSVIKSGKVYDNFVIKSSGILKQSKQEELGLFSTAEFITRK